MIGRLRSEDILSTGRMNRAKSVIRAALLLLTAIHTINLYRKTESNIARIAKFKLEMLDKMTIDSLDTEHKLDLVVNETAEFTEQLNDDSPQIMAGIRYLMGVVALLIAVELAFYIAKGRQPGG